MREIKFRIWDVKNKKMITFESEEADELLMCPFTGALYDHSALLYRREFKRMQFTGLKDKNGKDIYEGDILHMDDGTRNPYVVVWAESFTGWGLRGNVGDLVCWLVEYIGDLEVMGNIHENAELLTAK